MALSQGSNPSQPHFPCLSSKTVSKNSSQREIPESGTDVPGCQIQSFDFPHCLCEYSLFPMEIRICVAVFRKVDGKTRRMKLKICAKTMESALLNPLPEGSIPWSPCLGILGKDGCCGFFSRSKCLRMEQTQHLQKPQNLLP